MKARSINSLMARVTISIAAVMIPVLSNAQEKAAEGTKTYMSNGVFLMLAAVILLLAIVIYGLAEMVKAGATLRVAREKKKKSNDVNKTAALLLVFFLSSLTLVAQDAAAVTEVKVPEVPFDYWGIGAQMFYSMVLVIVFETVIIIALYRTGLRLLRTDEQKKRIEQKDVVTSMMESKILRSITDSHSPEAEAAIMMDHEYDGIRELDNNLPGWWKYGFYLTIVVAVLYLFNYHVLGTGLSSREEYDREIKEAERQVAEYKKNNANSVDESTVTLLTDAASISAGRYVYNLNCIPCHGDAGQGLVGPNLTDAYWLHKGGVVDIFKSIKYGWPDKGMKAWQQDLKPLEMQQVVSYIMTLQGTNPPNAKEKEGELYIDESVAPKDSVAVDSVNVVDSLKK